MYCRRYRADGKTVMSVKLLFSPINHVVIKPCRALPCRGREEPRGVGDAAVVSALLLLLSSSQYFNGCITFRIFIRRKNNYSNSEETAISAEDYRIVINGANIIICNTRHAQKVSALSRCRFQKNVLKKKLLSYINIKFVHYFST